MPYNPLKKLKTTLGRIEWYRKNYHINTCEGYETLVLKPGTIPYQTFKGLYKRADRLAQEVLKERKNIKHK